MKIVGFNNKSKRGSFATLKSNYRRFRIRLYVLVIL